MSPPPTPLRTASAANTGGDVRCVRRRLGRHGRARGGGPPDDPRARSERGGASDHDGATGPSSQLQAAAMSNNLVQYNSLNAGGKNSKMKMNYDDLKKFLIKEQNSAQV